MIDEKEESQKTSKDKIKTQIAKTKRTLDVL